MKPAEENDGPITVEQLLTHQSGLPREANAHRTTMEFFSVNVDLQAPRPIWLYTIGQSIAPVRLTTRPDPVPDGEIVSVTGV